jgi:hypothetical protein
MGESAGRENTTIPLELWQRRQERRGVKGTAQFASAVVITLPT